MTPLTPLLGRWAVPLGLFMVGGPATPAYAQAAKTASAAGIQLVTLPSPQSPIVAIRAMFKAGSIHDPAGKEGLAALTGLMVGEGGSARRSYSEIIDALYPLAADIGVNTDREVTVFATKIHREKLDEFTAILDELLLTPGFRKDDLERNREQLIAHLTTTLRSANDELLGLEAIQQVMFDGHPYEHSAAGTVAGLKSITIADVQAFYKQHYTRSSLILGIGGGYPDGYPSRIEQTFNRLPEGGTMLPPLPPVAEPKGREFTLIEKETASVGIHLGHAIPITRGDADFYPLMVANSFLGEHRTFHGRLMQQLRGLRGLNYGDYSYIEYWDDPPGTTTPPPNTPRRQQYFSVWVRPVVPVNAMFALRNAVWEVELLTNKGLSQKDFELTRDFLINYSKLWARSLSERVGFHMDSRFYGTGYFIDEIEERLRKLSVADVNKAAHHYLHPDRFEAVLVTANAEALKKTIEADAPSPISYENPVPPDVIEADKQIAVLKIKPASVAVVPVSQMFEK